MPKSTRTKPVSSAQVRSYTGKAEEWLDDDVVVPVDLIVPMNVVTPAGRRSARLGADHGKRTAQKSRGLEGALIDGQSSL